MATYAIVKTGGKQYKVAVGDLVKVEKLEGSRAAPCSWRRSSSWTVRS